MSRDLSKRAYPPEADRLHADVELGINRVRADLDALGAGSVAYQAQGEPGDVWASSLPTTISEAIDRIAAEVSRRHGSIPE